ncbi:hydroxyacid dehydrogenase [Williamsia sp. 1138]|uniref:D-2-hydroxyacid dehydrogenase n=1 Tax=Gordonia rubripertincta TaxID=36822 RepID=A0ABT4N104_GORRU|nr:MULTISPECIES: D-2-hydroxyacid dehydrogenase [Mycobacteriales]MCZ4552106.1 D-2-hydroxyacid dehydrogenase [Gordonia rubripertincta]OZG30931.1 hydroxyacid dehydrogenase [Williamsia sp. 1138]
MGTANTKPNVVILGRDGLENPGNLEQIREVANVRLATTADLGDALGAAGGADVLMLWDFFSAALRDNWAQAQGLRWVHVCAAGVDAMMFDELRASQITITNAHGVFDGPIAEFVLGSIIAQDKQFHLSKRYQQIKHWERRDTIRTAGRSALVIGTGGIGRAVARLLRAAGLEVTGAGRIARTEDPDFGTVLRTDELAGYAGDFDNIVTIAPLTEQTAQMIDADVLTAMKPSAHLINVGRGQLIDEKALIVALREGQIAAASLDVFETEPLAADNPLWDMENVHISAHMSGDVVGWRDELAQLFLTNLQRYAASEPLANEVDKEAGYVRVRPAQH